MEKKKFKFLRGFATRAIHSTIPKEEYSDNSGARTEYLGNTAEQLLLADLTIRTGTSDALNITNLEQGIECELGYLLSTIFDSDQDFVFTAYLYTSNDQSRDTIDQNLTIIITNSEAPPNPDLNTLPNFEKKLRFSTSTKDNSENLEAVLRLYLI